MKKKFSLGEKILPWTFRTKNFFRSEKKFYHGLLNGKKFFGREKNFTMDLLNEKFFSIQKSILNFFFRTSTSNHLKFIDVEWSDFDGVNSTEFLMIQSRWWK